MTLCYTASTCTIQAIILHLLPGASTSWLTSSRSAVFATVVTIVATSARCPATRDAASASRSGRSPGRNGREGGWGDARRSRWPSR